MFDYMLNIADTTCSRADRAVDGAAPTSSASLGSCGVIVVTLIFSVDTPLTAEPPILKVSLRRRHSLSSAEGSANSRRRRNGSQMTSASSNDFSLASSSTTPATRSQTLRAASSNSQLARASRSIGRETAQTFTVGGFRPGSRSSRSGDVVYGVEGDLPVHVASRRHHRRITASISASPAADRRRHTRAPLPDFSIERRSPGIVPRARFRCSSDRLLAGVSRGLAVTSLETEGDYAFQTILGPALAAFPRLHRRASARPPRRAPGCIGMTIEQRGRICPHRRCRASAANIDSTDFGERDVALRIAPARGVLPSWDARRSAYGGLSHTGHRGWTIVSAPRE